MKKMIIKILLALLCAATAILYFGPLFISGDTSLGVLLGVGFTLALAAYIILFDKINSKILSIWKNKVGKILCIAVTVAILAGISVGGYAFANVVKFSGASDVQTEYAILLGCRVYGTEPGIYLRRRINAAYDYLTKNPNSKIILSGGQGENEDISEAQCMFNTLEKMGIAPERMIIEDRSKSTRENFRNSLELMRQRGVEITELTVVTNDFHEYRASEFAKREGIKAYPHPCKTPWNGYMPFATREAIAVIMQIYLQ